MDEVSCTLKCFIKSHYQWLHIDLLQLLEGQLQITTKSNLSQTSCVVWVVLNNLNRDKTQKLQTEY